MYPQSFFAHVASRRFAAATPRTTHRGLPQSARLTPPGVRLPQGGPWEGFSRATALAAVKTAPVLALPLNLIHQAPGRL